MTWGEIFQYSKYRNKQKKSKNLKEFLDMEERIRKTFYNDEDDDNNREL